MLIFRMLILSCFPGVGIFDRAFEIEGYTHQRVDVNQGTDILAAPRLFSPLSRGFALNTPPSAEISGNPPKIPVTYLTHRRW